MEESTTTETTRYERPESQGAGKIGRLGGAVRRSRSTGWPAEVSSGTRGLFISHRTLTGLRALGLACRAIRFEIRSRKGADVWVMARGLGNAIAHGRTLSEATMALVRILAPEPPRLQHMTHLCAIMDAANAPKKRGSCKKASG